MRLELTRPNGHYPLKVARLPIPPSLHYLSSKSKLVWSVPRTGLEPARLSTLAPETSASTIPPPGQSSLCAICGAENETRTRDPNLGKVVLYQLSYFRITRGVFSQTRCKDTTNLKTCKHLPHFFRSFFYPPTLHLNFSETQAQEFKPFTMFFATTKLFSAKPLRTSVFTHFRSPAEP